MSTSTLAAQCAARLTPLDAQVFHLAFDQARADADGGADVEARWMRLRRSRESAAIAGYLIGLASTRSPVKRKAPRRTRRRKASRG